MTDLDVLAGRDDSVLSVWAGSLDGTPWLTRLPDAVHPAASTMKLALVIALHRAAERGLVDLDRPVVVHADFRSAAGGTYASTRDYDNDDEPWRRLDSTVSLRWLAERAIVRSSNLATNLLIEAVGLDHPNDVYAAVGATGSVLRRGIQDARADAPNTVTAQDLAAVVCGLVSGRLLESVAAGEVERLLAASELNDAVPAGLPEGTYVAHKIGWTDECCHDVGVVRPRDEPAVVLAVLCSWAAPGARTEAEACAAVADVTRAVWAQRPRPGRHSGRGTQ